MIHINSIRIDRGQCDEDAQEKKTITPETGIGRASGEAGSWAGAENSASPGRATCPLESVVPANSRPSGSGTGIPAT